LKAVAAMSLNRVIGRDNQIPWRLPADFRWFKQLTTGHVVLMGRKTFASLGKPLPNRTNIVVTRHGDLPGVVTIADLAHFEESAYAPREVFLIGGAQLYCQLLDRCTDLYLSVVQLEVEGDTFFPSFEDRFEFADVPLSTPDFEVRHYRNRALASAPCYSSPG
jgi:dihydrofolate reductase